MESIVNGSLCVPSGMRFVLSTVAGKRHVTELAELCGELGNNHETLLPTCMKLARVPTGLLISFNFNFRRLKNGIEPYVL